MCVAVVGDGYAHAVVVGGEVVEQASDDGLRRRFVVGPVAAVAVVVVGQHTDCASSWPNSLHVAVVVAAARDYLDYNE